MIEVLNLLNLGYEFSIKKDEIYADYNGPEKDSPPANVIRPYFDLIKANKSKALEYLRLAAANRKFSESSPEMQKLLAEVERFSKDRDEYGTMYGLAEVVDILLGSRDMQLNVMGNFDLQF